MSETTQYCTFYLDKLLFGIDVRDVQEILPSQPLTPVPLAVHVVRGLINLRGQIVTAIDLRELLQLASQATEKPAVNLVVRFEDEPVSLLIDRLGGVLQLESTTFESPPENFDAAVLEFVPGAHKLKDRLLILLDANKIVEHVARLHETAAIE